MVFVDCCFFYYDYKDIDFFSSKKCIFVSHNSPLSNFIMGRGLACVLMLVVSNIFMIFAWYGQIALKDVSWFKSLPLYGIIILSWLVALFEYCFQVPANRIGAEQFGGPFSLLQLKVSQEIITLVVFTVFNMVVFNYHLRLNHIIGFVFLVLAVFFIFKS